MRKTIKKKIIQTELIKEKMKDKLRMEKVIVIYLDFWTSRSGVPFLSVKSSYINSQFQLLTETLGVSETPYLNEYQNIYFKENIIILIRLGKGVIG